MIALLTSPFKSTFIKIMASLALDAGNVSEQEIMPDMASSYQDNNTKLSRMMKNLKPRTSTLPIPEVFDSDGGYRHDAPSWSRDRRSEYSGGSGDGLSDGALMAMLVVGAPVVGALASFALWHSAEKRREAETEKFIRVVSRTGPLEAYPGEYADDLERKKNSPDNLL